MQRTIRSLIGASFALLVLSEAASAAPCVTPTAACTEYVALRGGPSRVLVYRSHSLTTPVAEISHVIIALHGAERDAATSFHIAMAATVLAGGTDRTLVVAPRFAWLKPPLSAVSRSGLEFGPAVQHVLHLTRGLRRLPVQRDEQVHQTGKQQSVDARGRPGQPGVAIGVPREAAQESAGEKEHKSPAKQEADRVEAGEVVTKRDDSQAHQEKQDG